MQGRGTMQPGGDKAANWIADRFQKLGLKPLGDKGSYLQKIDFKESTATAETIFKVGEESLAHGTDFAFVPMNNGNKETGGEMVFVAYGIQAQSIKRDDLAGVDVSGKVVVMLEGPPASIPKKAWDAQKAGQVFVGGIMMKGAAAIVFIGHGREEHSPDESIQYSSRRQIMMPDEKGYPEEVPPIIYVGAKAAEKLFAKSGVTLKDALAQAEESSFKPIKLNQKAKIVAKYKLTKGISSNVAGYIEGSDPTLKSEAVLFSAHYDAYGIENGRIYPGAADNALGVAEMLAVAEAFSKMKPKRSMVFLAVTGEEYGLYGSKYWAKKPTWDIKKVAADLNLDGIGSEVYAPVKTMVGYGAEHSTLGAMLADVAKIMDINVIPDPIPDEKIFLRSDHYSFVERGVPALMLMGAPAGEKEVWMKRIRDWEKTDYHNPGDTIKPDWAWEGAETVAEVMGIMGWRISEMDKMPEWLSTSRFGKLERGNTKEIPEEK
ncbi:MAG: M28 family peptidase [Pyrinomonadaceae bacterium]